MARFPPSFAKGRVVAGDLALARTASLPAPRPPAAWKGCAPALTAKLKAFSMIVANATWQEQRTLPPVTAIAEPLDH